MMQKMLIKENLLINSDRYIHITTLLLGYLVNMVQ